MKEIFRIKLAEELLEIQCQYSSTREFCRQYLIGKDECEDVPPILITVSQEDITFERNRSESEDQKDGIVGLNYTDQYLETLAVYRKVAEQLIEKNIFLFHGSVIAVDGAGYIFTAKSGTGKSTHTRLWRKYFGQRAFMVNDDKPLLRITSEGVVAYGTPWDGKHRLSTNTKVPLKGICILRRDVVNHIEPISGQQAYPMLLQQTYRSVDSLRMKKILNAIDLMIQTTKIYALGCNMNEEAAVVAYEGMQE